MKIKNISVRLFLQVAFFEHIQYFRESSCFDVLTQTKQILPVEFPKKLKCHQVNRIFYRKMEINRGSLKSKLDQPIPQVHIVHGPTCPLHTLVEGHHLPGSEREKSVSRIQLKNRIKLNVFMLKSRVVNCNSGKNIFLCQL